MGQLRIQREPLQAFLYGDTVINFTTASVAGEITEKILIYLQLNPGSNRISLNLVDIKGRIVCLLKQSADKHLPLSIYLFKRLFATKRVSRKHQLLLSTPQKKDIIVVLAS